MTVHRWFANKVCPGDYLYSRHGKIAAETSRRLSMAVASSESHGKIAAEVNQRMAVAAIPYEVRITVTKLRIRNGPRTDKSMMGYIKPGVYAIIEEADGAGASNWGKLKHAVKWSWCWNELLGQRLIIGSSNLFTHVLL